MKKSLDFVLLEVVSNNLMSIAEQAGATLIRCAFSPNIKERRDCSAAILTADGDVVAQATHIPMHLGSMIFVGKGIIQKFGRNSIRPGDIFIDNEPYRGGSSHLSDFTITTPVFYEDRLAFFASNTAHHVDVGGRVPGSTSPDSRSIFEEGIRIPLVRIARAGTLDEEMLDLITWNCRDPEERKADIRGQIAANHVTVGPLTQLCQKYGYERLSTIITDLIDYTRRRFRRKIADTPDGEYTFTSYMDNDGILDRTVPIKATVRISGQSASVDFSGSGPQATGAMNAVRSALLSGVYFAFKSALDPHIPSNQGFFETIAVHAPEGTIVNPRPGAAVAVRVDTVMKVVDALFGALFQALSRERVIAGSNAVTSAWLFYGRDERNGGRHYTYLETLGGGSGARSDKDGLSGIQVYVNNTSNLPVESLESEYPLIVEQYALIRDSGGSGKHRGGMGIRRDIRVLFDTRLTSRSEGHKFEPWGIHGGLPGAPGELVVNPDSPARVALPAKKSNIPLKAGDVVSIRTPGAGGYGPCRERSRERIATDLEEGSVSSQKIEADYGVKQT